MTEAEAEIAFKELESKLVKYEYTWILQEVREEIRQGRVESKPVVMDSEVPSYTDGHFNDIPTKARKVKVRMAYRKELTPHERLSVLLTAIEQLKLAAAEFGPAAYANLNKSEPKLSVIQFIEDETHAVPFVLPNGENRDIIVLGNSIASKIHTIQKGLNVNVK